MMIHSTRCRDYRSLRGKWEVYLESGARLAPRKETMNFVTVVNPQSDRYGERLAVTVSAWHSESMLVPVSATRGAPQYGPSAMYRRNLREVA